MKPTIPDKKMVYMVGLREHGQRASFLCSAWAIARTIERDQSYLTAGGLQGPRLKLDYAFEKNLKGTDGALHSVDIRLPF